MTLLQLVLPALAMLAGALPSPPSVRLRNGVEMPVVAAGTWQYNDSEAADTVQLALEVGHTHIDTAYDYKNQRGVSLGLQRAGKPRNQVFVTTKVPGCGLQGVRKEHCYDDTLSFIKEDIAQLSTSYDMAGYVDLVLVHFPPCTEADPEAPSPVNASCFKLKNGCSTDEHLEAVRAQWAALEAAYKANLTRAIGVSNYCSNCLFSLMASGMETFPMVNQVMYHVGMGADPQGFKTTSEHLGIVLQAWSPLGLGGHGNEEILKGNLTTSIGLKHKKSPAQVALKWILANNVTVATKSSSRAHLQENADVFDFSLSEEEKASLDAADFHKDENPSFLCLDKPAELALQI
mmetsp:Transcript_7790/g.13829  ORF Transcript_7790/g.13829 Transcript_7790/m.13829 type:complete len:347 (-) Transcript_7790:70-1110(-)|eukprot:CAMPEP_0197657478 /NCGR_PEP_ID=MMETSP1338-20131121/44655_1 /TAXON_ID=43686 ORGANISM="Pelagodinium beii, Strain RCC1491" /NCGR_SAMPLE_ID=MMETSP1338 /ASSEMBLY_ACC=CAM_ASM_000754 /LENGTH=346 /DNA_ID=CAMNT_0043233861 /DNA_START=67 /DNA_END=1107 /DNA_ORIENTATION=-